MDYLNSTEARGYIGDQYADKVPTREPIKAELQRQAVQLKNEMDRIHQMMELIEQNPAIEKFINLQRGYIG